MEIKVMKRAMQAGIDTANDTRKLLKNKKILMINLIGSPGAGKTLIIENTLEMLGAKGRKAAVIEGDIASSKDALRLQKYGIPIVMINTGGNCHLDAASVAKALKEFDPEGLDIIIIENVGNLVCPAGFDLGEDFKVAVSSVTEGDDKPEKYPLLFREATLLLLNKVELISAVNFDKKEYYNGVNKLNGAITKLEVSAAKKIGMDKWINWLDAQIEDKIKLEG